MLTSNLHLLTHSAATDRDLASGSGFITFLGSYNIFIAPICGVSRILVDKECPFADRRRTLDHHCRLLPRETRKHTHTIPVQPNPGKPILWNKRMEFESFVRLGVRSCSGSSWLNWSLPSIVGFSRCEAPVSDWMGCMFHCRDVCVLRALPCTTTASTSDRLDVGQFNDL